MNPEQPRGPESQSQALMPLTSWATPVPFKPANRFSQAAQLHAVMTRCKLALRRRWWLVLLCFLVVGVPALVYAWLRPPTFQSQAVMWMIGKLNLPEGKLLSEELTSYMGTQADLLKSVAVQARAYDRIHARFPELMAGENHAVIASVEELPFKLSVRSSMKSSVLELRAVGPSPETTRAFLDAVMEEYLSFKKDARKQTSFGALATITDQVREAEKQVQTLQRQRTAFETTNNISFLSENRQNAGKRLADLGALLSDLHTEAQVLERLTPAQLKEMAERPKYTDATRALPGEATAQNYARISAGSQQGYYAALEQLQLLKARRDDFGQYLRPTHSKMIKLNQDITGLEKLVQLLQQEGEQLALGQLASRKQSVELQMHNLQTQYAAWETNAIDASRKLAEFDRMKQDLERAQALYDRLLGLVQTVDLTKGLDQEPLTPLAPASLARPTLTNLRIAAAGILLALVLGGGLLLWVEVMDDRFTSVDELSTTLPEEILGQIPESQLKRRNGKPRLLKHPEEHHAFAEAFRNLRSSLLFMFEQAERPKVILVTSAVPKEGKTTVATNFAAALAIAGSRVLLVDADLRRGSLHKTFGVGLKPGLCEVLTGQVAAAEAIVPVSLETTEHGPATNPRRASSAASSQVCPSSRAGKRGEDLRDGAVLNPPVAAHDYPLFLLPAGASATSSSELFLRCPIEPLLRQLAREFDYVIIDSAPMLATDDAASLGPKVDGIFMVVRSSYTSSRMTQEALSRLRRRRAKVLGLIYNRAPVTSDYYYRYSSHYRNGSEVPIVAAVDRDN